ncbi:glycosyltransferase [Paracoccus alcaliphilus]|uniref:glycosyltransferase n=1 Tax=Paracoccus alcaliphilus TaxID=34002 RepID=UPI000B82107D|nr:glycosyltransferase [Paracoccus alcaliphilus]WCR18530.1 hypothetical protein JHW40_01845 [Paracoccus alcaliphilus]
MKIVGICRFSLLGRGDWKVYQGKPDSEVEAIAAEQARKLFAPERMEQRLAAFEHLTLAWRTGRYNQWQARTGLVSGGWVTSIVVMMTRLRQSHTVSNFHRCRTPINKPRCQCLRAMRHRAARSS